MDATSPSRGRRTSPADQYTQTWRPERCDRIALVLQGGGALGAYQAGRLPGAARGQHRARLGVGRLDRRHQFRDHRRQSARSGGCSALRTFWERITERKIWHYTPDGDVFRKARNATSSLADA